MANPNLMSTTSNITHWTCQCGVQVPLGVSHRCGGQPVEVTYNPPWPTDLIASQQARIAALEALFRKLGRLTNRQIADAPWDVKAIVREAING